MRGEIIAHGMLEDGALKTAAGGMVMKVAALLQQELIANGNGAPARK